MDTLAQAILDEEWKELVSTAIDATPDISLELRVQAAINNAIEDAAKDRFYPPRPSERDAYEAYVFSWDATWSEANTGAREELIDYVEAREDEEWIRRGC